MQLFLLHMVLHSKIAIGAFPDDQSSLMLICAILLHVAGPQWGTKPSMNMDHLVELDIQNEANGITD